jgi:GTP-binding protein
VYLNEGVLVQNKNLRNIAIIAHVDHGKTTLVDYMFKQGGIYRVGQVTTDRVMDNMDLEREKGITISAKNCAVHWNGIKINILDTPGHADFGGEVERALMMVDGVVLLVDAAEGPLPQTRFVLKKALEANLKIIVCVNKIDRQDARPEEVLNEIYDLFIDLDATDEQIDFPVLYSIGRSGIAQRTLTEEGKDLTPLMETIVSEIPAPSYDPDQPFQMLVANLGYSDYLGRLAIGRIFSGHVHAGDALVRIDRNNREVPLRVVKLHAYDGPQFVEIDTAQPGEIIVLAGVEEVEIGDTICTKENPIQLPRLSVEEPTVAMRFTTNTSPLSGKEGRFVQAPRIWERLQKETLFNVALQVERGDVSDTFIVKGRGEMQLAVLIETMRREGFELSVGRPEVLYKEVDGKRLEPIEHVYIDCDENYVGIVTDKLSQRKGYLIGMVNHGSGRARIEFSIPSRGLIGYRNQFLTDTRGTGILSSYLSGYEEYRGDFPLRQSGSLVSDRAGEAVPFALWNLEARGELFILPGMPVYEGMIIGEHCRDTDLNVNPCKTKKLTNMRAAGKDEAVRLTPIIPPTLEKAIDFIREDEMVEVTPQSIRLRKTVLPAVLRKHTL